MPTADQSVLGLNQYAVTADRLAAGAIRLRFSVGKRVLAWREVFAMWRSDAPFCSFFSASLAATPFEAFFWETPPLTVHALALPFECVVVSAPAIARQQADPTHFATQLGAKGGRDVVVFRNLGADRILLSPATQARAPTTRISLFSCARRRPPRCRPSGARLSKPRKHGSYAETGPGSARRAWGSPGCTCA